MKFAAVAGHRSGRAMPSLRDARQQQSMERISRESIYRDRNAVQTKSATSGGMHNVSVNAVGLPALKKGIVFPDKTIFVSDLHEFTVSDGSFIEGGRKVLALMVKDTKKYATTGGWGFQAWAGGDPKKPVVTDATKQCFTCHEPQKAHDYVFSTYIP